MKWLPVYRSFWDLSSVVCIYWKLCCLDKLSSFAAGYSWQSFFPPISSVSRSTIYFHGGKRIRTKPWKETWLVNFQHHFISAKLLFMISCPIFSPEFTPVLPLFTYMCFYLTLLPTMHIRCPRDHLLQALTLYKLWFDNSSLITQEKTVPGSDSLRIYTQLWDAFPKIYFYLIIY